MFEDRFNFLDKMLRFFFFVESNNEKNISFSSGWWSFFCTCLFQCIKIDPNIWSCLCERFWFF